MDTERLLDAVASSAHEAWRQRLLKAGWVPGAEYDLDRQTHPGLVPYDRLPAFRRGQLLRFLRSECDPEGLVDAVENVLGEPEWTAEDVCVGMRVHLMDDPRPGTVGTIVSWVLADAESGAIEWLRVRWPGGEEVDYAPAMHELLRAKGS